MKRSPASPHGVSARRLGAMLVAAFTLTVASFMTSAMLSEHRAGGIETAAGSITGAAIPSIEHLALVRTELRHVEALLDDYVYGKGIPEAPRLQQARKTFESEYALYQTFAPYEGEQELWSRIATSTREMNASIDSVIRKVQTGDSAADELVTRAKPAIEHVDDGLEESIALNARKVQELSNRITSLKRQAHSWGLVLRVMSLLLAAIAAFLVIRVVSRFAHLMDTRAFELERFAGRVAHDIRSPLQSVGLALELTRQRHPELDAKTKAMAERGLRTLQRLSQLVDGLLVFAQSGKTPTERAHTNIKDIILDVTDEVRAAAEEKDIELRVEEPPPWEVGCSSGVLISLMSNLVGNAIKYMGDAVAKRIDVQVRRAGRMVRIEVRDTGPGVPPELRKKIFDPYVRATASNVAGIGLGLATVRRLAEAHGGAVGVEGNDDGGSVFWFQLPESSATVTNRPSKALLAAEQNR